MFLLKMIYIKSIECFPQSSSCECRAGCSKTLDCFVNQSNQFIIQYHLYSSHAKLLFVLNIIAIIINIKIVVNVEQRKRKV